MPKDDNQREKRSDSGSGSDRKRNEHAKAMV